MDRTVKLKVSVLIITCIWNIPHKNPGNWLKSSYMQSPLVQQQQCSLPLVYILIFTGNVSQMYQFFLKMETARLSQLLKLTFTVTEFGHAMQTVLTSEAKWKCKLRSLQTQKPIKGYKKIFIKASHIHVYTISDLCFLWSHFTSAIYLTIFAAGFLKVN